MGKVLIVKCKPCPGNDAGVARVDEEWYEAHKEDYLGLVGVEGEPPLAEAAPEVAAHVTHDPHKAKSKK